MLGSLKLPLLHCPRWVARGLGLYREAFRGLPREVWLLAIVTLIYRSGTIVMPFLTIYLTTRHSMDVQRAGAYLSLYGAGAVLGTLLGGQLAKRIGNIPAMQIALATAGVGFAVLGTISEPRIMACVLFATGVAAEGFRTPSSTALGLAVGPELRPRAFALRRLAINLGMAIGPVVGGVLATIDYGWLFAIDGTTCVLAAVATRFLWRSAAPAEPSSETTSEECDGPLAIWSDTTFLAAIAGTALMMLAFAQLMGTYPLTLKQELGYAESTIGGLMAWNTLLIVGFEMVLLHLLRGLRASRIALAGLGALTVGYLLVPYGPGIGCAVLAMTTLTLGEMLTLPVIESLAVGLVPVSHVSRAIGLLNATFASAFVIAPVIGTAVYGAFGFRALWGGCALITLLAALAFLLVDARTRGSTP